jgi:NarL family two-component system response regulator LiaR
MRQKVTLGAPMSKSIFRTYLISENRLAGAFLFKILAKDRHFESTRCDRLPAHGASAIPSVFVFDSLAIFLPLSECLRRVKLRFPEAKTLVVGERKTDEDIVRLLHLGASGFVEHSNVEAELRRAVRSVAAGRYWVSKEVLQCYVQSTCRVKQREVVGPSSLTSRENQVLDFVSRRLSNKEIATVLHLKESTIKYHLSNIFGKLQVDGRRKLLGNRVEVEDCERF